MFKKKKEVKKIDTNYRIPQIDEGYEGIKTSKDSFKKSKIGSPLFGSQVKDTILVRDISKEVELDVRKTYDAFRDKDKKLITDDELIQKYGTKYFEFQMIDNETRRQVYGSDITPLKSNNDGKDTSNNENIGFSFIQDKNEFFGDTKSKEEERFEHSSESMFDFGVFTNHTINDEQNIDYEFGSFKPKYVEPDPIKVPEFLFKNDQVVEPRKEEIIDNTFNYNNIEEDEPAVKFESNSVVLPKIVDPYRDYTLPPLSIFRSSSKVEEEMPYWLEEKKEIINKTLIDFDIAGEVINYTKGPTFTRYEILLQSGVNVRKIANLYDTFQMNLGARTLRIQAPIPGKKTVGVEVPNDKAEMVCFGDVVNDDFIAGEEPLKIALGKDIDGKAIYTYIDKMPHGLVGGATNSGKSVCMNTILISLLMRNKPDDLKLILIDPKTVELISYNELPHLVTPVITDPEMASESLKWACEEMDRRYAFFSENRVRNIKDYNRKASEDKTLQKMSYMIIVIDELADLMMVCSSDVEDSIKRLTQKARAAGIHLIVATQRPTVDVVKGTIKANIPTRIAFKVFSQIDSATILDEGGAESLLGKGDMLIKEGDIPVRLQGAYISDSEIDAVTDFIRKQAGPDYIFTHDDLKKKSSSQNFGGTQSNQESVEMLYDAAAYFLESGTCSINALTQRFGLGFNRAQRIVSALEEMGIVSSKNSTKGREMLVNSDELMNIFEQGE